MSRLVATFPLPSVTVPLQLLVPSGKEHYFNTSAPPVMFTTRAFEFWGIPVVMPMVHAFLKTCAAGQSADYRFLFDLLGTELATNAIRRTRSSNHGYTYMLVAERSATGLKLTCRDNGVAVERRDWGKREHLSAPPPEADPLRDSGRGLALVDALATSWGDTGYPRYRQTWFTLAYDLTDSAWAAPAP